MKEKNFLEIIKGTSTKKNSLKVSNSDEKK